MRSWTQLGLIVVLGSCAHSDAQREIAELRMQIAEMRATLRNSEALASERSESEALLRDGASDEDEQPLLRRIAQLPVVKKMRGQSGGPTVALALASSRRSIAKPLPVVAYENAYWALRKRQYARAVTGFQRYLQRWPHHNWADNAQHGLGQAHYARQRYRRALIEFDRVVRWYPRGNKAPDALLKAAYCREKLGDAEGAQYTLTKLVRRYPRTAAAKQAQKRLTLGLNRSASANVAAAKG